MHKNSITVQKSCLQSVLGIRILVIRKILALSDPDPLVRGMDPDPFPFSYKCWADWNNACKNFNTKFYQKIKFL